MLPFSMYVERHEHAGTSCLPLYPNHVLFQDKEPGNEAANHLAFFTDTAGLKHAVDEQASKTKLICTSGAHGHMNTYSFSLPAHTHTHTTG